MRVFNKKLNRLLAIMLASVMGATSLPATQVSADTPSSEYDISNDAASDDISDSKIPDEQASDNNATEEKQPQQLTVEYTPADDIYVGNKVVPVVKSDRADAAVDNLKYTVVEGKNLIEKDTDFASNGIWTAKDTGTVRIKVTNTWTKHLQAAIWKNPTISGKKPSGTETQELHRKGIFRGSGCAILIIFILYVTV